MSVNRTQRVWDIGERVVWTAIQGGAAEGIILATGWSQAWTVPLMALLATMKTVLASKFGTTSAATLPASMDAGVPGDEPPPTGRHAVGVELKDLDLIGGQDMVRPADLPAEILAAQQRHPAGKKRDYPA